MTCLAFGLDSPLGGSRPLSAAADPSRLNTFTIARFTFLKAGSLAGRVRLLPLPITTFTNPALLRLPNPHAPSTRNGSLTPALRTPTLDSIDVGLQLGS